MMYFIQTLCSPHVYIQSQALIHINKKYKVSYFFVCQTQFFKQFKLQWILWIFTVFIHNISWNIWLSDCTWTHRPSSCSHWSVELSVTAAPAYDWLVTSDKNKQWCSDVWKFWMFPPGRVRLFNILWLA